MKFYCQRTIFRFQHQWVDSFDFFKSLVVQNDSIVENDSGNTFLRELISVYYVNKVYILSSNLNINSNSSI